MIEMGQRNASTDTPAEIEGAALASVGERMRADFPFVREEYIDSLLTEFFGRTRNARVQTFRVLLADRDARAVLRSYPSLPSGDVVCARTTELEEAR